VAEHVFACSGPDDETAVPQPSCRCHRQTPRWNLGALLYRNPTHTTRASRQHAALELKSDDQLLEVGCGGGTFLALALASGCEAKAVDHSADMVALASQRNATACRAGHLEVIHARAEELPFAADRFTCAAMTNAFFFLQDPARTLQEFSRVLKPAGRLVIYTTAPDPPPWMAPPLIAQEMRFFTDEQLHDMACAAGFIDVSIARLDRSRSQLLTATRP
jgi:ubiquinone/menaquinone biosynthesis C-methylase UbiE